MHSLNIFSDLFDRNNKDLEKALEIISKNNCGIIVMVRNPEERNY